MTTERPYQAALSMDGALEEIRSGRGTQFSPAVVDAFLVAFSKQPAVFALIEPETHLAAG
jgi:HD-GYP domain-containing protein (c-di-GMP phosphodiesterase class II)